MSPNGSAEIDAFRRGLANRYRFERELGRGGMAIVFLAEDLAAHRRVAIKVMRPELTASLGAARFLREIDLASRLTHPNLLPLLDAGEAAGCLYYVMPFVAGGTLRALLRRRKQLSVEDAVRITVDVAEALAFAHGQGVLHRDIKPENILFDGNRAMLADFGIARAIGGADSQVITSSGIVVGTATYMSPEHGYANKELDARSDLYELGCVLYEMLAGEPPFSGPNPQAIVARHASAPVPSIRIIRPNVSEALEAAVMRALAKAPPDRFQTAEELASAVRAGAVAGTARRPRYRRGMIAATVILAAVAGGSWLALRTPLHKGDWLLVADFDGPVDDARLGAAVRDLATQAFRQSRFLQVFDRRQLNEVLRRAGVPETTHVDADRARELAQRSSVRAVLRGSVRRLNQTTLELVLHVVSAEDGGTLASVVGTAAPEHLPDSIQALANSLRSRLGERRAAITANRPLRDVMTPSMEAFRKYAAGADATSLRNDHAASNALMWDAVRLDSGFAAAWAVMGANYLSLRQLDSARLAYGKALSYPNRLSVAELYRLRADAAYAFDHDLLATVRWYDLYLAEVPTSRSGRTNRAVYRSALGQWDEAVRDLRDAVPFNPFGAALIQPTLFNLAVALVVVGDRGGARTVRDSLTGAPAMYVDVILAGAESRWAAAESVATAGVADARISGFYRIHAVTALASALAAQGARRAADSVLAAAARSSQGANARWYERSRLLMMLGGDDAIAPRMDLVPHDTTAPADMLRALWSAVAGDTAAARSTLLKYAGATSLQAAALGQSPALIDAWIAARRRDWRYVADHVAAAAQLGEMDPTIFDRPDSYQLRWLAARAYEELAQPDSALAFYELLLRPTFIPPGHYPLRGFAFAGALQRAAVLRARSGDTIAAVSALDELLGSFTKPDASSRAVVDSSRTRRARWVKR